MVTVMVLLNIERQNIKDISQKIVDMNEASEVYSVASHIDFLAIVRLKSNKQIPDVISGRFEELDCFTATVNLIPFSTFSRYYLEHMVTLGE